MNDEKELYTVAEMAVQMKVSKQTIYRWFTEGLTFIKVPKGRIVRKMVDMDDMRDFLLSNPELQ